MQILVLPHNELEIRITAVYGFEQNALVTSM